MQGALELVKRLEEVRLLESRKSARLMDQDTDFARLADMAGGERKRQASHTIDVPATNTGIPSHVGSVYNIQLFLLLINIIAYFFLNQHLFFISLKSLQNARQ